MYKRLVCQAPRRLELERRSPLRRTPLLLRFLDSTRPCHVGTCCSHGAGCNWPCKINDCHPERSEGPHLRSLNSFSPKSSHFGFNLRTKSFFFSSTTFDFLFVLNL